MSNEKKIDLKRLNAFLKKNKSIDFRTADLRRYPNLNRPEIKAYQRMLRVVPNHREDLAKALLKSGIYSSLQIANTPKKVFIQNNLKLFNNDRTLAEQVYKRAVALRKAITLKYMARVQQTEPYARATGLLT